MQHINVSIRFHGFTGHKESLMSVMNVWYKHCPDYRELRQKALKLLTAVKNSRMMIIQ